MATQSNAASQRQHGPSCGGEAAAGAQRATGATTPANSPTDLLVRALSGTTTHASEVVPATSGAPLVLDGLDAVRASTGRDLGVSAWRTVTGEQVALYLQATGDVASDPATVPPLMLLALTNLFLPEVVEVRGVSAGLNVGTGPVRFPQALAPGLRVRAHVRVTAADEVPGGVQTTMRITVEVESSEQPAVVVDALSRWLS